MRSRVPEVPADCTVSMLAEAAAAELDLPYAQTKISVNGEAPNKTNPTLGFRVIGFRV